MLERLRNWWLMRQVRKEARGWTGRFPKKDMRAANEGGWSQQPIWHGWEDRWMQGHNDHPAEKFVTKSVTDLAKELEQKKAEILQRTGGK